MTDTARTSTPKNPILLVINAGSGETPIPSDALVKLGDILDIHDANTGEQKEAIIIAIVPKGTPPDYAIADQAEPKQPRPLMVREGYGETANIIKMGDEQLTVLQNRMQKGLVAALARAGAKLNDTAHTPLPWAYMVIENKYHEGSHAEGNKTIISVATVYKGDVAIARCGKVEDAALIVKAVNCHAGLVEALKTARNGLIWFVNETGDDSDSNHEALEKIDLALSKAGVK